MASSSCERPEEVRGPSATSPGQDVDDVVPKTRLLHAIKWILPLAGCFLAYCWQSILLHMATWAYIDRYADGMTSNHTRVAALTDLGHNVLGRKAVPMMVLDAISVFSMATFFIGCLLFRDLRLWTKVFFCCGALFFWKGVLDYITILPDSIGWARCVHRLQPEGVAFFKGLTGESHYSFLMHIVEMELYGLERVGGHGRLWPVRYCGDMVVSGHTFVMFLFLLATMDLIKKVFVLFEGSWVTVIARVAVNLIAIGCIASDLYLIVVNHFHYTIDVVLSLLLTMLTYTNAGLEVFTDWFVQACEDKRSNKRYSDDNGVVSIPGLFIPFCCFRGYYEIRQLSEAEVIERQQQNDSALFESLRSLIWDGRHGETEPLLRKDSGPRPEVSNP